MIKTSAEPWDFAKLFADKYLTVENFLAPATALQLHDTLGAWFDAGRLQPAGVGAAKLREEMERTDLSCWLGGDESEFVEFFATISRFRDALRDEQLSLPQMEFHATAYPPGAFYRQHVDNFRDLNSLKSRRVLSCVYFLNRDWMSADGGALRLYLPQGAVSIEPQFNRLVVFLSEALPHEVEVTTRLRFAVSGWLKSAGL